MKTLFLVALFLVIAGAFGQQLEFTDQMRNDFHALNYALTLEHLEATFYTVGQTIFSESDFVDAGFPATVYNYVNLIRDHEQTHVQFLSNVLASSGANVVLACNYTFDSMGFYDNVSSYLAAAMMLENTGVSAYDGAASSITDAGYLTAAATIATTEARHAAFLNELNGVFAFNNNSFDTPRTPQDVYNSVKPLIAGCPANQPTLILPLPRDNYEHNTTAGKFVNGKRDFSGMKNLARRDYQTPEAIQNDNDLLNYALHLEQFGAAFYTSAATKFAESDFLAAGFNDSVYQHFQLIVLHEQTHAAYLRSVLVARDSPLIVDPCTYNLDAALASVNSVLATAQMVENLEVTAYDGSIEDITDEGIVQAAATIATIEARHAAYLNNLLLGQGVPTPAFDSTHTPLEILNITAPFFASCPQQVPIPQPYYLFDANQVSPVLIVTQPATLSGNTVTYTFQLSTIVDYPVSILGVVDTGACNSKQYVTVVIPAGSTSQTVTVTVNTTSTLASGFNHVFFSIIGLSPEDFMTNTGTFVGPTVTIPGTPASGNALPRAPVCPYICPPSPSPSPLPTFSTAPNPFPAPISRNPHCECDCFGTDGFDRCAILAARRRAKNEALGLSGLCAADDNFGIY